MAEEHALPASSAPQIEQKCRMTEDHNGLGGFLPPLHQKIHGKVVDSPRPCLHEPDKFLLCLISSLIAPFVKKITMYTNVAPYSHLAESPFSSSTVSNPVDTPKHVGRQVLEDKLSDTTSVSGTVSLTRAFEAITIKDHAPALTLAPVPAISGTGIGSSWTTSRTRSESSPMEFLLGTSPTSSALENEVTSSQRLTESTAAPASKAHSSTRSTIQPGVSSTASKSAPTQTATASPVHIESARTTGIIIGSVLGGLAVLLMISLAAFYLIWRRRRRRQEDQADREKEPAQKRSNEAASGQGNTTEERKRSTESPMTLPLQGAANPRTLRSEPIIVDTISPITPIQPHLSRWTSEKADIPSPPGHPAVDVPPHLRHHPLFASTHHGHNDGDGDGVSPCSSSSPSPSPSPGLPIAPAAAAAENTAFGGFLFFDSPSSRSSTRRPSTRDSSAPRTALSMPPPHRPPPRRRHTRAGGQGRDGRGGAARSNRGSGSSVFGGGDGGGSDGCVEANCARPSSPPPPLIVSNAARSKSLHNSERPAVWI